MTARARPLPSVASPDFTPKAAPSSVGEIKALTGLRGIAALYVVIFHTNGHYRFPSLVLPFIRHGYIAVDLFFILSGFVMAMTYSSLFEDGFKLKNFKHFILLRLARIYPLFALMTLLTAVLIATVLSDTYPFADLGKALLFNFTLTHVWGFCNSIVPPSWSISTEWLAYLLFPIGIYVAMRVPRRYSLLGLLVSFAVLIYIAYGPVWLAKSPLNVRHGPLDIVSSYAIGTTLRCLASFYIGLVAYRFHKLVPARAAGILFVCVLIMLCFRESDLWLIGVFAVLIMSLSHDTGAVARLLRMKAFYWLGLVSYALYLIHDLIQKIIFKALPFWGVGQDVPRVAWAAISIALSLALAALCHHYYEKPSRRIFRNLVFKTRTPKVALTPAE